MCPYEVACSAGCRQCWMANGGGFSCRDAWLDNLSPPCLMPWPPGRSVIGLLGSGCLAVWGILPASQPAWHPFLVHRSQSQLYTSPIQGTTNMQLPFLIDFPVPTEPMLHDHVMAFGSVLGHAGPYLPFTRPSYPPSYGHIQYFTLAHLSLIPHTNMHTTTTQITTKRFIIKFMNATLDIYKLLVNITSRLEHSIHSYRIVTVVGQLSASTITIGDMQDIPYTQFQSLHFSNHFLPCSVSAELVFHCTTSCHYDTTLLERQSFHLIV